MRLIRAIDADCREQAARLVESWGYPRKVSEIEVERGSWFAYENGDGVAWFVPVLTPDDRGELHEVPGWLAVHGIGSPEARKSGKRLLSVRLLYGLEVLAEVFGADRLYSLIPRETPDMPVAAMRRLLRRFGWQEDEMGSFKELGE